MNSQNNSSLESERAGVAEQGFPTFDEFYFEVHGHMPFVWQSSLAAEVWKDGAWPDQIAAPTGAGKTSTVDIAVWALARQVHEHGVQARKFPLRIFLTVERRLVVDGAAEHATKIAVAIEDNMLLNSVKMALSALLPDDWDGDVLGVTSLHGGKPAEKVWLRPFGAQIITCTVTQLSSRTLFRGVGVAPGLLPIHAALTGIDRLILVDEPHLVPAAVNMWRNAEAMQSQYEEILPLGQTVLLGATVPPYLAGNAFEGSLKGDSSPIAQSKLKAVKPAIIQQVSTPGESVKVMVQAAYDAWQERDQDGGHGIVVVANTIDRAAKVRAGLAKRLKNEHELSLNFLTSTVRPLDRSEATFGKDSITVATQTIEVGVDLDACALITELAAMPALVQRFGRFNRSGDRKVVPAVVVANLQDDATKAIYGEAQLASTLNVLERENVDGIIPNASDLVIPEDTWEPEPRYSKIEPLIHRLTATRPVALVPWEALAFGPDRTDQASIMVAWRENLDLLDELKILPEETITIPLWAARKFVSTNKSGDANFSDTEARATKEEPKAAINLECRIRQGESWGQPLQTDELLADATLVLPTSAGGYSPHTGWTGVRVIQDGKGVDDHSMRAVLGRGQGYFDAGVLLGQAAVIRALDEELELYDEVLEQLQELYPDNNLADSIRVEGRFVAVGTKTLERDFGTAVGLADHSLQVAEIAEEYATLQGLSEELVSVLKYAGQHHDFGKSDKNFQHYFNNFFTEPLAKPRGSVHRANKGLLPLHWRHEILSARSVEGEDETADLIRYLVITHHGWGRRVTNHAGIVVLNTSEYEALEQRFGPWGLAMLETTLRIADWHASEKPKIGGQMWKQLNVSFSAEEETPEQNYVSLTGMRPYSLNMLFGGIGALAASGKNAKYRVRDGIVQIAKTGDIVWDAEAWNQAVEGMSVGAAGIDKSRSEITKRNKWRSAFKEEMLSYAPVMESMLFDSYPEPQSGRFFSVPVHNRNGNPFDVLRTDKPKVRVDSLFNPDSEKVVGKLNGGLDTGAETRMTGETGFIFSEHHLAWAIAGMASLGMPATEYGVGVSHGVLRVPAPDFWVTLEELRDLFISPLDIVPAFRWRSASTFASQQVKFWEPILSEEINS